MNHFCYNSLFGFSEKELEKMENNHRIVVDGDLIDSAKAYQQPRLQRDFGRDGFRDLCYRV